MIEGKDIELTGDESFEELMVIALYALSRIETLLTDVSRRLGGPSFDEWKDAECNDQRVADCE